MVCPARRCGRRRRLLPSLERFSACRSRVPGVRNGVGVTEIANFAKYEFTGPGAEVYLSRLMTNRMPRAGRLVLTPMLNQSGKLIGDFTIARASPSAS